MKALVLPTALVAALVLNSCGSHDTIQESVRVRQPIKTQTQGQQTGANSQAGDGQQPATIDPEIKRFTYDPMPLKNPSRKLSGIDFDYGYGLTSLHPTSPKMRIKISNAELNQLGNNLGVVITGYPMNDSSTFVSSNTAVNTDGAGVITIKGESLKPATVYKLRVHFFNLSATTQTQNTSQPLYLGASSQFYQMVTDGENDPTASARARIVMRGFGEANDWALGRYDRQKGYTQHGGGGWCHIFYNWVIKNDLKTRSGSQNTHYDPNYWSNLRARISPTELLNISQKELIHGDYFRVGSHAAMIIAFDKARNEFITLEGNFNNSVQMYKRRTGDMSWVGHITKDMIR